MSVNVGSAEAILDINISKFVSGLKTAQQEATNMANDTANSMNSKLRLIGKDFTSVGKTLSKRISAPIVGAFVAATKASSNFDSAMSKVSAISGATGDDLDKLREKAKEMGASTKFSATESAEALNYMAMAGWKTNDMLDGLEGIMNLAAASGEDLATTSDIVTDALTAFGLQAKDSEHFADVLAATAANANTNVGMLGESFKYVAPIAGALGYSVEDTNIALGLMANAGIKASQSGTTLRGALTRLAKPTGEVKSAMEKYGISITDAQGKMLPLGDLMEQFREKLGGLSRAEQAAAATTLFGKTSMSGMLAIINASEKDYNKLTKAIYNADGSAKTMAETMLDNLGGSFVLLKSALEGAGIRFGEVLTPAIRKVVDALTSFFSWLANASEGTIKFATVMGILLASIGPVILSIGMFANSLVNIIKLQEELAKITAGKTVGAFIKSAAAKVADMASTIADTVAYNAYRASVSGVGSVVLKASGNILRLAAAHRVAIIATLGILGPLALMIGYMVKTGTSAEEMATKITEVTNIIVEKINSFASAFPGMVNTFTQAFTNIVNSIVAVLPSLIPIMVGAGIQLFMALVDSLKQIISPLVAALPGIIDALVQAIIVLVPAILQAGITLFTALVDAIPQIIPPLVEAIPQIIDAIVSILPTLIPALLAGAVTLFTALVTAAIKIIPQLVAAMPKIIAAIVKGIIGGVGKIKSAGGKLLTTLLKTLLKGVGQLLSAGGKLIAGLVKGIIGSISSVGSVAGKIKNKIKSTISNLNLFSIGKNIIQGLVNGMKNMLGSVKNIAKSIADKAAQAIKDKAKMKSPSRVWRDEIGKMMVQGLIVGLEAKTPTLLSTAAKQVASLKNAYSDISLSEGIKMDSINAEIMNAKSRGFDIRKLSNALQNSNSAFAESLNRTMTESVGGLAQEIGKQKPGDSYNFGNITIEAKSLEDIMTVQDFFNVLKRAKAFG